MGGEHLRRYFHVWFSNTYAPKNRAKIIQIKNNGNIIIILSASVPHTHTQKKKNPQNNLYYSICFMRNATSLFCTIRQKVDINRSKGPFSIFGPFFVVQNYCRHSLTLFFFYIFYYSSEWIRYLNRFFSLE